MTTPPVLPYLYLLLILWPWASYLAKPCPSPELPAWIQVHSAHLRRILPEESTNLLIAIISGDKKSLSAASLQAYRQMQLLHLFTPSGLHLAAIWILLRPLWRRARRYHPYWGVAGEAIALLIILICFQGPYYSLRRMALWRLIYLLAKHFRPRPVGTSFILAFTWDFYFGSYLRCPISFYYSFAFCALLLMTKNAWHRALHFLTLYGLLGIMAQTPINIFAVLINAMVIPVFSLLFPGLVLFFGGALWWGKGMGFWLWPLDALHRFIVMMADLLSPFTLFFSYPLALAIHVPFCHLPRPSKLLLLGVLLLLHSTPLSTC